PAIIIVLGYIIPVIPVKKKWFRLRDIPAIKAVLIAITVSYLTSVLPMLLSESYSNKILIHFAERFFFILAITIPFDIRDQKFDSHSFLKTLPLLIGEKKAKLVSVGCMIISGGLFLILFYSSTFLV